MDEGPSRTQPICCLVSAWVAGAAVLGLEVLSARTMAPAIGTGPVAWAFLLAVALGALAAGNLIGGFLASRTRSIGVISWPLTIAAAPLIGLALAYPFVMRRAAGLPLVAASLTAALATQCVPMLMLGTVAPLLIELGAPASRRGPWAGAVLAAGSGGGIAGALITALLLLPALGLSRSYLLAAAVLAGWALPLAWAGRRWVAGSLAMACLLLVLVVWMCSGTPGVVQSPQGQIEVRKADGDSALLIDGLPQTSLPARIVPWDGIRHGYLLEVALLLRPRPRNALVIGLGAGLAPRLLAAHEVSCESVELDPMVVDTARREFGFRGPAIVGDGRAYLARTARQWDLIVLDVCTADRLAFHMFTAEALRIVRERLAPGGLLAVQFIGDDGPWSSALGRTVEHVFGGCLMVAPRAIEGPVGPRWLFAGYPAALLREHLSEETEAPWRVVELQGTAEVLRDDHFAAEFDWARTATRWRQWSSVVGPL